jgi:hypothetical protein
VQTPQEWVQASFTLIRERIDLSTRQLDTLREVERQMLHKIDTEEVFEDEEPMRFEIAYRRVTDLSSGVRVIGVVSDQGSMQFGEFETVKRVEVEDDSLVVMIDFEGSLALTVHRLAWAVILLDG